MYKTSFGNLFGFISNVMEMEKNERKGKQFKGKGGKENGGERASQHPGSLLLHPQKEREKRQNIATTSKCLYIGLLQ